MSDTQVTNVDALRRTLQRLLEDSKVQRGRGIDKRRHPRHYYTIEARAKYVKRFDQLSKAPHEFKILTKDLSRSGMSFIHEYEMYAGEVVQVEVQAGKIRRAFLLRVVRCRRAGLRVFDVAGEFVATDEVGAEQN